MASVQTQSAVCLGAAAMATAAMASLGGGVNFVAARAALTDSHSVQPGFAKASVGTASPCIGAGLLASASVGAASYCVKRSAKKSHRVARLATGESIAATAVANGNFKTLVAALRRAGLVETLSGSAPFTVFAPTDAAFSALLAEMGISAQELLDSPDLKSILLFHVAAGTTMSSSLKNGQKIKTMQGNDLLVKIAGGKVEVGSSTVTAADVACSNGVIHVVDSVLVPTAKFDPAKQVGVTQPLGFFDPLGFCKVGDEAGFRNLRAAEIKHGRVAMMAAVGAVAQHFVKFPGFEAVPSGLQAAVVAPGAYGFVVLFANSGLLELGIWTENPNKEPGNFGDPLGFNQYNADMRNREINNGRMAMLAAFGILAAELATGKDGIAQLGF